MSLSFVIHYFLFVYMHYGMTFVVECLLVLESSVQSGFSVSRDPNRDPNRLSILPEPKITGLDQK